jgi:hypothetical protein
MYGPRPAVAAVAQASARPDKESVLEFAEDDEVGDGQGEKPAEASKTPRHAQLDALLGYRLFSRDGYGGRAAPYEDFRPGPTGGLLFNNLDRKLKYSLEGTYTSDRDYLGDFLFDQNGDYRFHLRTESLWHNLDQKPFFSPDFKFGRADSFTALADYIASPDPSAAYGLRVEQDQARARIKIHEWPLHLNLGYWRLLREGTTQLRYADHAFEGPTNTVYGRAHTVDRETHEGEAGFDAHLGPIDLIYSFQIREFMDHAGIPRDPFIGRTDPAGVLIRGAGLQQHNETPDSRFLAHTVKAHTSLSGGLVGAASYTYGKRQNRSALTDIHGAAGVSQELNNIAGDLTYTPCKEFTLAVKYRRQEIDSDTPSTITSSFALPATTVTVRPPIDTRKEVLTTTLTIHPTPLATVKGEYRGQFVNRDLVRDLDSAVGWKLPGNSASHRGSVAFLSRPVKGLRLKAQYSYMAVENPSYDTSPDERHDGELLVAYTMPNRWGANANYQARRESRGEIGRTELFTQLTPQQTLQFTPRPFQTLLAREQASDTVTVSVWFLPVERVTLSGGYALLRTRAEQGVLLTSVGSAQAPLTQDAASYTSQAQVWSLGAGYRPVDQLDLSLQLQHIRSLADFSPVNTAGIGDISRISTEESSLAARADYRFTRNFSCTLHYGLRDYNDRASTLYEGTVHSVTAFLTTTW